MKTNYHTHTVRCKHATGSDKDFVESALRGGFDELGFSDHSPWPYASGYRSRVRMGLDELPGYVAAIRALKEEYADRISIKIGLECEYFDEHSAWLKETVEAQRLDYLLFGNHFYRSEEHSDYFGNSARDRKNLFLYLESALLGIGSGLFQCMAHPDLFMKAYPRFDESCATVSREICRLAREKEVLLEYNLSGYGYNRMLGIDGFPHRQFWEIAAETGCRAVIGYDAHVNFCLETDDDHRVALRLLRELGIEVVDRIPFFER